MGLGGTVVGNIKNMSSFPPWIGNKIFHQTFFKPNLFQKQNKFCISIATIFPLAFIHLPVDSTIDIIKR